MKAASSTAGGKEKVLLGERTVFMSINGGSQRQGKAQT